MGATYHIDYANGKDSNDGLSPAKAWKHSPGDANAQGKPKDMKLAPGDTLLFKGGVVYHGSIELHSSGTKGKVIRLDGNASGKYGKGPAILDGSKVITSWKKCKDKNEAKGNPLWKDIFYADVDIDISKNFTHGEVVSHRQVPRDKMAPWQRIILCDGDKGLLPVSQFPKPKDTFYPDKPGGFLESAKRLEGKKAEGISIISDAKNLAQKDPDYYQGMQIGVHGGNNHVYFASVKGYIPEKKQIVFPFFKHKLYPQTRYAFFNSVRLITEKGEWSVEPLDGGKTRFFLLPDRLTEGKPANIGFPVLLTGIKLAKGASHYTIDGFLIQRYSGGDGAVAIMRNNRRSTGITVANCEIRFLTGHAGIGPHHCDNIVIRNCYIHHCPGWTTAIFLNRVKNYELSDCLLVKNSGSGIRHYESKHGHIHDNTILDHYGMHSSTLNLYEGCEDVLVENNYLNNIVTINRNAKKLTFRNNVVDSQKKSGINLAIWGSGRTGGRKVEDIVIENNTFVNLDKKTTWGASIFVQGKASAPTGMVIRNNILDVLKGSIKGTIENNIYINKTAEKIMGKGSEIVGEFDKLFKAAGKGDFRRLKGGPLPGSGADLPPPVETWSRP